MLVCYRKHLFIRQYASGLPSLLQPLYFKRMYLQAYLLVLSDRYCSLHFDGGLGSKRTKIFWTIFAFIFCYEIIPQWIFPVLTGVSIFCLVDHTSSVVRNVFGGASNNEGMGVSNLYLYYENSLLLKAFSASCRLFRLEFHWFIIVVHPSLDSA